jgi:site-specific DNA-methyltransferase (cytosine-N4-specific)
MPPAISPPSQTQLLLPVLDALDSAGGRAKTADLYETVAEQTGIPTEVRVATETLKSAGTINTFARSVRWAQQRGKLLGLMRPVEPGIWEITDKGRRELRASRPGKRDQSSGYEERKGKGAAPAEGAAPSCD